MAAQLTHYVDLLLRSTPLLLKGMLTTLHVLLFSSLLSFGWGILLGILSCNRLKIPLLSTLIEGITFTSRAIPFFVQLLIVYFVLPDLLGFNLEPFGASIVALGICSSGYVAQLCRGALNAIPNAQWEAALSLGYTTPEALVHIILPQMFRIVLPSFNNELDSLLKSTAIISSIGMLELTRMGMNIVSREMEPVPIYLGIAFLYLCMSAILNFLTKKLEKKVAYAGR